MERGLPLRWAKLLGRWMRRQRWYLGKEDRPPLVKFVQSWPILIKDRTVWWCILEASSMGLTRQYQLPMVLLKELGEAKLIATLTGTENGFVVDAWTWPPFAEWVMRRMADSEPATHLSSWHEGTLRTDLPAKPLLKEQSNTAITLGETCCLQMRR